MPGDELAETIFGHVACLRNARDLEVGCLRRDIGIEAAARCRHQVDRDGCRWILGLKLVDVGLDAIDERLVGRAEICLLYTSPSPRDRS